MTTTCIWGWGEACQPQNSRELNLQGKMRNATMSSNVLAAKWGSCSILPTIISAYLIRSTAHSSDNARSELKLLADSGSGIGSFLRCPTNMANQSKVNSLRAVSLGPHPTAYDVKQEN